MNILPVIIVLFLTFFITPGVFARTTPEDIVNTRRAEFEKRSANYSPIALQKLQAFDKKIAELNKSQTDELEENMLTQGLILDEYIRRNNLKQGEKTDGIKRDLSQPAENARYWLTYAHEAVAFQAAKIYIFNLTSEKNLNNDIISTISTMQSDMNGLRNKVIKSQNIIEKLVSEK